MKTNTKTFALLAAVMLTLGLTKVNAQTHSELNQDAEVTLNIKLHKIQSLVVNTGQKTVNLEYIKIEDYAGGVTSNQKDHLEVFSTGGFNITAKSSDGTLKGIQGNDKTINVGDVKLTASVGTNNTLGNLTMNTTALSSTEQSIVKSGLGGRELKFNVEYKTQHDAYAYINHYIKNENPTVYTTTVTYTIAPN